MAFTTCATCKYIFSKENNLCPKCFPEKNQDGSIKKNVNSSQNLFTGKNIIAIIIFIIAFIRLIMVFTK